MVVINGLPQAEPVHSMHVFSNSNTSKTDLLKDTEPVSVMQASA
jgi:hypothetical protein